MLLVRSKMDFGTGPEFAVSPTIIPGSSKVQELPAPRPSGSSAVGSAQIILQTQFPSFQQKVASSYNQNVQGDFAPRSLSRSRIANTPAEIHPQSPSPIQRPGSSADVEQPKATRPQDNRPAPKSSFKQPHFYREPSPMDYGFDDDDDFEDMLAIDEEIKKHQTPAQQAPHETEEDYGDSDDYDDMVGFAEEVEYRQSLRTTEPSRPGWAGISQAPQNSFETSKRIRSTGEKDMYSHVDVDHSSLMNHPWSRDVKKALKDRFKLQGFRHNQLDAINATLGGQDVFVLMPTGGGKSLCYQLPAVVQSGKTRGLTIVISPLLSLMNDQVQHLRDLNIRAASINSEISLDERREVMNHLKEDYPEQYIQLLYITPEMINKSQVMINALSRLHKKKKLARIVIDEAHCVSQWGHDFRPDYTQLGAMRDNFPNVPLMALTATATENVKVDVMHNLGMEGCPVHAQSFNRPNLFYEVRSKKGKGRAKEVLEEMADMIKNKYRKQSGIIYTLSRKSCEQIAGKLEADHRIRAHHYHASMKPEEKWRVQKEWQSGRIQVVVATIAFGMGIDKADVRFVIHHTIPKSLEGYYQETGRAGRDGKQSECYLYYGYQDTAVLKEFINDSDGSPQQKERQMKMLTSMVQYCENRSDCRRVQVLAYFSEPFKKDDCRHTCDNCRSDAVFEPVDFTAHAQAALRIVKQTQSRDVTLLHCVDILRGATNTKIRSFYHHEIPEFGAANGVARGEVERLFYRLIMELALKEESTINRSGFATQYLKVRGPLV
jgi:bloom syndrome protein